MTKQYIAFSRNSEWWITIDGLRVGPFGDRDAAIAHAVGEVKSNEKAGIGGEVSWDDPDDGIPTVYKSDKLDDGR